MLHIVLGIRILNEDIEQTELEKIVVMNERPYEWYIGEHETGVYGYRQSYVLDLEFS